MNRTLRNKVIVVTGGANGIGFNIAKKCLSEGAKTVILLDKDEEQGNAAAETLNESHGHGKTTFMYCDVTTDLETVGDNILAAHGTIDVLVNSAGISDENNPKKVININTTALLLSSLKFYEHMRTDKGGAGGIIINISSTSGFRITPYAPIYTASKFAVTAFTRSLGHDDNYKKSGVRVVALCPGFTETQFAKNIQDVESKSHGFASFARSSPWQTVDAVGDGAVEVFRRANSGTVWLIEGGQPVIEIS